MWCRFFCIILNTYSLTLLQLWMTIFHIFLFTVFFFTNFLAMNYRILSMWRRCLTFKSKIFPWKIAQYFSCRLSISYPIHSSLSKTITLNYIMFHAKNSLYVQHKISISEIIPLKMLLAFKKILSIIFYSSLKCIGKSFILREYLQESRMLSKCYPVGT